MLSITSHSAVNISISWLSIETQSAVQLNFPISRLSIAIRSAVEKTLLVLYSNWAANFPAVRGSMPALILSSDHTVPEVKLQSPIFYSLLHYKVCYILQSVTLYSLLHSTFCYILQSATFYNLLHSKACYILQSTTCYMLLHSTDCYILHSTSLLHYNTEIES